METLQAEETKKGSKLFKVIGLAAVIGVMVAVGRMLFRVFSDKPASDTPEGA